MEREEKERRCGILMHISSLWSECGIGDFGECSKQWIDILSECGFTIWQTLPFCLHDEYHSPYKSFSAFSLNYMFISPARLLAQGLITKEEYEGEIQKTPYICEYDRLDLHRYTLLALAASRVKDRSAINDFMQKHPYIEEFCRFMAIREQNGGLPWNQWQSEEYDPEVYFTWCFSQYEFVLQWLDIKNYANSRGILVVGDIPIYVAYDSCDVYFHRDLFLLDSDGRQKCSAGCPPDYFCADGQMWGNPIYDWSHMKQDGYLWWCRRIEFCCELFDRIRIDHFRGLASYWSIPAGALSAREGQWRKGPGRSFIDAIKKVAPSGALIAEDLGHHTPDVQSLLRYSKFPGMRILQFGFISDKTSKHIPYNYPSNCVAYTGTHDNNTLLSFIFSMDGSERQRLFEYCGYAGTRWEDGCDAVIRTLCASHADTVILPIQDILRYGNDTRMNIPGKAGGSWSVRFTLKQLESIDRNYYKNMLSLYGR